jgi:hypothetical protein
MSGDDRFDQLFMTVAQQAQGIEPLLDQLFGFLRRKTDFFTASPDKISDMVMGALKKQGELYDQDLAKKAAVKEAAEKKKKAAALKKKKDDEEKAAKAAKTSADAAPSKVKPPAAPVSADDDILEMTPDGEFDTSKTSTLPKAVESNAGEGEAAAEEEDNTPPPIGNGGSTDKYTWTQTLAEVTVTIPLPAGTKAKMLNVDIGLNTLKVGIKGETTPIIDGKFHKGVFLEDTLWNIDDGNLILDICKQNKMEWWKCVMEGDIEINTQKVQPENSKLSDLDGETRQTVEKMMFDQRQKAAGLPSSEELQKQNMMKKFMESHPEMDFSKAKFN